MEIQKINEHFTVQLTMSEAEIQTLVGLFEDFSMFRNCPTEDCYMGMRKEIYEKLKSLLDNPLIR